MPIIFDTIDQVDKTPRTAIENDTRSGVSVLPSVVKGLLLIGQKLAAGAQPVATPLDLFRPSDSEDAFGAGSVLDAMCKAAFKANPQVVLTAVAVADTGGSVAGAADLTGHGNATADGGIAVRIANKKYSSQVTNGDTPQIYLQALRDQVNADPTCPVTVAVAISGGGPDYKATFTSRNKGTVVNGIVIGWALIGKPGITLTLSTAGSDPTLGNLAAGAGVASITAALAACAGRRFFYPVVGLDDTASQQSAEAHVNGESDAEHGRGEMAIGCANTTLSALTTMATTVNNPRNVIGGIRGSESWAPAIAAALGAVCASEPTPNRPLNTLVLEGINPPPVAQRWIRSEQKSLLANGVTPLVVIPGEKVAILRAVTTYTVNAQGNHDDTLDDVGYILGLDYTRDAITSMFDDHYARARWADADPDGLLPGDVATPDKVKRDLIDVCRQLEEEGVLENIELNLPLFDVKKVIDVCQFQVPADVIPGLQRRFGKLVLIKKTLQAGG